MCPQGWGRGGGGGVGGEGVGDTGTEFMEDNGQKGLFAENMLRWFHVLKMSSV